MATRYSMPKYNIKFDSWNGWTDKSKNIQFKSSSKEYGDGEEKLGEEYDTKPLGQNYSYDLHIKKLKLKIECKKLDKDNSFRLGVEVSSKYTDILICLLNIFDKLRSCAKGIKIGTKTKKEIDLLLDDIFKSTKKRCISLYDGLKKHEVSASNLEKANNIIKKLVKILSYENYGEIELYCSYSGEKKLYNICDSFTKLVIEDIQYEKISDIIGGDDVYSIIYIKNELECNLKYFYQDDLKKQLNNIVRGLFKETLLIIVDEKKGYLPIKNMENIYCNRITSGAPRCKFVCQD